MRRTPRACLTAASDTFNCVTGKLRRNGDPARYDRKKHLRQVLDGASVNKRNFRRERKDGWKILVDNGQEFDFGKTSREYAAYRDIYPKELYERLYSLGAGTKGSRWLDLGTGTGVIPRDLRAAGRKLSRQMFQKTRLLRRNVCQRNLRIFNMKSVRRRKSIFRKIHLIR